MNQEQQMIRRIEELEEMVSILGDSVVSHRKEIENLQGQVITLERGLAYTRGMFKDLIRCVSQLENG